MSDGLHEQVAIMKVDGTDVYFFKPYSLPNT